MALTYRSFIRLTRGNDFPFQILASSDFDFREFYKFLFCGLDCYYCLILDRSWFTTCVGGDELFVCYC